MRRTLLALCALAAAVVVLVSPAAVRAAAPKHVHAILRANWADTSIAAEASEFLADTDTDLFWKFVEAYAETVAAAETDTPTQQEQFDMSLATASALGLRPHTQRLLRWALVSRRFSPAVEAQRQLASQRLGAERAAATQTLAFVEVSGRDGATHVFSSADAMDLALHIKQTQARIHDASELTHPRLYGEDHAHPASEAATPDALVMVLHGCVGTPAFAKAYKSGASLAADGHVVFVARQAACAAHTTDRLVLQGYGVELAIKNMEYSALDDTVVQQEGSQFDYLAHEDGDAAHGTIDGFDFATLTARKPDLTDALASFRDVLLAEAEMDASEKMNVWDMQHLGFQASHLVRSMAADPLKGLVDVSQNFPSLGLALSRMAADAELQAAIESNQKSGGVSAGKTFVTINGRKLAGDDIELFALQNMLAQEDRILDRFAALGLREAVATDVLALPAVAEAEPRVDMRMARPVWLNNLEEDAMYQRWSSNVEDVLDNSGGAVKYIARNLYNQAFVINAATYDGLAQVGGVWRMMQNYAPARFGFVLTSHDDVSLRSVTPNGDDRVHDLFTDAPLWEDVLDVVGERDMVDKTPAELPEDEGERDYDSYVFESARFTTRSEHGGDDSGDDEDEEEEEEDRDVRKVGRMVALAFDAIVHAEGTHMAVRYLYSLFDTVSPHGTVSVRKARALYKDIMRDGPSWSKMKADAGAIRRLTDTDAWVHRAGITTVPSMLFNGKIFEGAGVSRMFMHVIFPEVEYMKDMVARGVVTNAGDALHSMMEQPGVLQRHHPALADVAHAVPLVPAASSPAGELIAAVPYVYNKKACGGDASALLSHWVVTDLTSHHGLLLAGEVLAGVRRGTRSRVALVHNGMQDLAALAEAARAHTVSRDGDDHARVTFLPALLPRVLHTILHHGRELSRTDQADAVSRALMLELLFPIKSRDEQMDRAAEHARLLADLPGGAALVEQLTDPEAIHAQLLAMEALRFGAVQEVLRVPRGESVLVSNGNVRRQTADVRMISKGDFAVLEDIEWAHIEPLVAALGEHGADADVVMAVASFRAAEAQQGTQRIDVLAGLDEAGVVVSTPAEEEEEEERASPVHVVAVVDPLSKEAQRVAPLLVQLRDVLGVAVRVVLNPTPGLSEFPLETYYRYVADSEPRFTPAGGVVAKAPSALFKSLPAANTLTMGLDVPEPWLVESVAAVHDLDNIRLGELGEDESTVFAEYSLDSIVLTGSCSDMRADHPAGLTLVLGTDEHPLATDTMVMKNLGYFQLRANPGGWALDIAPGQARDVYRVVHAHGGVTEEEYGAAHVLVRSFGGKEVQLRVEKKPGKEYAELEFGEENTGLWASVKKGLWGGGGGGGSGDGDDDTIHIFSVASGHLYERFLKIMMLSVLNHTDKPVKFWFLSNFLSPKLKRFLPAYAREYGFEYELVTYKWPTFLNKQTEKQRIIWAYKILFLDVLFPLSVKKIIFVDADQIVRADLAELRDLDLEGAPYGYTPFCTSREETLGFQFWRQGYWKDHLGPHRSYHISALYVVDLVRFRQMRAGDRLRIYYENLSKDKGSLSNLDQDLPNYAQNALPIKSLPIEWLWCETWCSDVSLENAKTIDLCNNPLTKEPKLDRARRIVDEWEDLDNEVRAVEERVRTAEEDLVEGGVEEGEVPEADVRRMHDEV